MRITLHSRRFLANCSLSIKKRGRRKLYWVKLMKQFRWNKVLRALTEIRMIFGVRKASPSSHLQISLIHPPIESNHSPINPPTVPSKLIILSRPTHPQSILPLMPPIPYPSNYRSHQSPIHLPTDHASPSTCRSLQSPIHLPIYPINSSSIQLPSIAHPGIYISHQSLTHPSIDPTNHPSNPASHQCYFTFPFHLSITCPFNDLTILSNHQFIYKLCIYQSFTNLSSVYWFSPTSITCDYWPVAACILRQIVLDFHIFLLYGSLFRQLSTEQVMLQQTLQKESKANKRLSMENEELLWKLHNGLSPRNSASFPSSPVSPRWPLTLNLYRLFIPSVSDLYGFLKTSPLCFLKWSTCIWDRADVALPDQGTCLGLLLLFHLILFHYFFLQEETHLRACI